MTQMKKLSLAIVGVLATAQSALATDEVDVFTCQVQENRQTVTLRFAATDIGEPSTGKIVDLSQGVGSKIQIFPRTLFNGEVSALEAFNKKNVFVMDHSKHLMLMSGEDGKGGRVAIYLGGVTRYRHGMLTSTIKDLPSQDITCSRDEL